MKVLKCIRAEVQKQKKPLKYNILPFMGMDLTGFKI